MNRIVNLVLFLSFYAVSSACGGDIVIKEYDVSQSLIQTATLSNPSSIDRTLSPTTIYVDILPSDNLTAIPSIILRGGPSAGNRVFIYIGAQPVTGAAPYFRSTDASPALGGLGFGGIDAVTNMAAETVLFGGVQGNFGSPGNDNADVTVDRLVRFDVGGICYGDFFAVNAGAGGSSDPVFVIQAGGFSAESLVRLLNGDITRIAAVETYTVGTGLGDMKAQIVASSGNIGSIIATGRITTFVDSITANPPQGISALNGQIGEIIAGQEV